MHKPTTQRTAKPYDLHDVWKTRRSAESPRANAREQSPYNLSRDTSIRTLEQQKKK